MIERVNGKFAPGNSGGPGRPKKEREARYYEILTSAVSFSDWRKIIQKARDQALRGDKDARKWLADYIIGTAPQRHELTGSDGDAIIVTLKNAES